MEWLNQNAGLVIGIVLALINVGGWFWTNFNKAYKIKRANEDFHETVDSHSIEINELKTSNKDLLDKFDALFEITKIQIRYSIVSACNDALERKEIDQYQLQAIEDMYTVYTEILHANSYVTTIVHKVRKLPLTVSD